MQTEVISSFIYVGNVYFCNKVTLISKNTVFFSLSPSLLLSFYVSLSTFLSERIPRLFKIARITTVNNNVSFSFFFDGIYDNYLIEYL